MTLWRGIKLVAFAIVLATGTQAQQFSSSNNTQEIVTSAGVVRRLGGASPGNVAGCYTPFHNSEYPLFGGAVNIEALRNAIRDDFRIMSKHFTHVRTYYSMHYNIEVAPIAAEFGLKLYLGVFLTKEAWGADETAAAVRAIQQYSSTVEAVLVGNENLKDFGQRAGDILAKINEIKQRAGGDAWRVKYGTVQRANEFIESKYDGDMQQLNNNLDILGVNIYPFFDNGYNGNNPTKLLDDQWNKVVSKYPRDKIRLTETGFPTAGKPSWLSPNVIPNLDSSFKYYEAVVNWSPAGYEGKPKFWFQTFDRRPGDPAAYADLELYFGFFTTGKAQKRGNYPRPIGDNPTPKPKPPPTCTFENGVDYNGNDIGSQASTTAEGCFAVCSAVPACGAFTWTPYNGGTCWLKSGKTTVSSNAEARSALVCKCNQKGLEPGVDYVGNDIGSAAGASAESCIPICQARDGCQAFSWTNYNGGTCWLKSGKGDTTSNGAATSGVVC